MIMTREGLIMDRNQAKALLPIIQAYAEGKEIEIFDCTKKMWETAILPHFDCDSIFYRIKPETTCRPFKYAEECWEEMQKHQPFGWVKTDSGYEPLWHVNKGDDFNATFKDSTFADGTPYGIKEEE